MPGTKTFKWKEIFLGLCVLGVVFVVFILQTLFAVRITPVEPKAPPEFVGKSFELEAADEETDITEVDDAPEEPLVVETEQEAGLSNETDEVRDLPTIANGVVQRREPHDKLIELLSNSDSEIRIAAANALAEAIRGTMAGWDTHQQFWKSVEGEIEIIRSALYEALVDSVNQDFYNAIPYSIAYMPGQDDETLELLVWTANNHASASMRKIATFFVVELDPWSDSASKVLQARTSDPTFRVRWHVLNLRLTRWTNSF